MRNGYSMLELLVALVISTMMITATLEILSHMRESTRAMATHMENNNGMQYCLELLSDDVVKAAIGNSNFSVEKRGSGDQVRSHLKILAGGTNRETGLHIDWIAAVNEDEMLTLYRREYTSASREEAMFIPLFNNLNSFDVELLDSQGQTTRDQPATMLQIIVSYYADPEYDLSIIHYSSKTFCLKREIIMTVGGPQTEATETPSNNNRR